MRVWFLFRLASTKIGGKKPQPPGDFPGIPLYLLRLTLRESTLTTTIKYGKTPNMCVAIEHPNTIQLWAVSVFGFWSVKHQKSAFCNGASEYGKCILL